MGNRNDFFIGLDHLATAARNALRDMPEEMSERQKKIAQAFLTRIPDQVGDIKSFIEDPHTVTHGQPKRIIDPF